MRLRTTTKTIAPLFLPAGEKVVDAIILVDRDSQTGAALHATCVCGHPLADVTVHLRTENMDDGTNCVVSHVNFLGD